MVPTRNGSDFTPLERWNPNRQLAKDAGGYRAHFSRVATECLTFWLQRRVFRSFVTHIKRLTGSKGSEESQEIQGFELEGSFALVRQDRCSENQR